MSLFLRRVLANQQSGIENTPEQGTDGEFVKGFKSSWAGLKSTAKAAFGSTLENGEDFLLAAKHDQQAAAQQYGGNTENFSDIDSLSSAGDWLKYQAGNAAGSLSQMAIGGGAGSFAAKTLAKEAGKRALLNTIGATVGATATTYPQQVGENVMAMYGEKGHLDQGDAAVAYGIGAVQSALDVMPFMRALDKTGLGKRARSEIVQNLASKSKLGALGSELGKTALEEGSTEAAQETLKLAGLEWVDANKDHFTLDGFSQIMDSFAAGAVGGVAIGGAPAGMNAYQLDKPWLAPDSKLAKLWQGEKQKKNEEAVPEQPQAFAQPSLEPLENSTAQNTLQVANAPSSIAEDQTTLETPTGDYKQDLPKPTQNTVKPRTVGRLLGVTPPITADAAPVNQRAEPDTGLVAPQSSIQRAAPIAESDEDTTNHFAPTQANLPAPITTASDHNATTLPASPSIQTTPAPDAKPPVTVDSSQPETPSPPISIPSEIPVETPLLSVNKPDIPSEVSSPSNQPEPVVTPQNEPEVSSLIDKAAHEAATSPMNNLPEPSQAQKEAGNYKVGKIKLHGLDISIENPKGSQRKGVDKTGKPWSVDMNHHYGYIKGTIGKDKDHLDVFLGDQADNIDTPAFVIDQVEPGTGKFDEHKIMLGFPNLAAAKQGYLSNYPSGWNGLGNITQTSIGDLKEWLKSGKTNKPFKRTLKKAENPTTTELTTTPVPNPLVNDEVNNQPATSPETSPGSVIKRSEPVPLTQPIKPSVDSKYQEAMQKQKSTSDRYNQLADRLKQAPINDKKAYLRAFTRRRGSVAPDYMSDIDSFNEMSGGGKTEDDLVNAKLDYTIKNGGYAAVVAAFDDVWPATGEQAKQTNNSKSSALQLVDQLFNQGKKLVILTGDAAAQELPGLHGDGVMVTDKSGVFMRQVKPEVKRIVVHNADIGIVQKYQKRMKALAERGVEIVLISDQPAEMLQQNFMSIC